MRSADILPIPAGFPEPFARGLFSPDIPAPTGVRGPHGKQAEQRYNVYRNNVTVSLINALASIFPAVERITGADFFRAMARFHIRESPPNSPLLFEYGRDFADFIETYEYAKDMPWLSDVARIERAWLDAYHAADAPALRGEMLLEIAPEKLGALVFRPHPATRIISSSHPAITIFAVNRNDGMAGRVENHPENGLISRLDDEVSIRLLPPGDMSFTKALIDGERLAAAAASGLAADPGFDLSLAIGGIIAAGAFSHIEMENIDVAYDA